MGLSECTLYPCASIFAEGTSGALILERREVGNALMYIQGRRTISLAHSCHWIFGGLFHIPGSLSPSLEILRIILEKQTYKRALERRYLERTCVHACMQLCTRGYTVVYTRVYSTLLGRRYSLGILGGIRWAYLR